MRKRNSEYRLHPAAAVLFAKRQILLLMIPILRALFSFFVLGRFPVSIWMDIIALGALCLFGILRYRSTKYQIQAEGISIRKGVLCKSSGFIPYGAIVMMRCQKPLWLAIMRCGILQLYASGEKAVCSMPVFLADAAMLLKAYRQKQGTCDAAACHVGAKGKDILFFSLISSRVIGGILSISAAAALLYDLIGTDLLGMLKANFRWIYYALLPVVYRIPPFIGWMAYLMLLGVIISFVVHLFSHLRFTASREGKLLRTQCGLPQRVVSQFAADTIGYIEWQQSFLLYLAQKATVSVVCGKRAALLLTADCKRIGAQLSLLLPEYPVSGPMLRPKYLRRFYLPIVWWSLAALSLICCIAFLLPAWRETATVTGWFVMALLMWRLCTQLYAYKHTGLGINAGVLTLRYTAGGKFYTVLIAKEKILRTEIKQSLWQKRLGICDLTVYPRYGSRRKIRLKNLSYLSLTEILHEIQQ